MWTRGRRMRGKEGGGIDEGEVGSRNVAWGGPVFLPSAGSRAQILPHSRRCPGSKVSDGPGRLRSKTP
eukprot:8192809-Pyramimonas_sp.AAC.1